MRAVLLYILLIATILPTFSQWGTIAYYRVNKEYITRVLCENRNRPQLHCDGKCFLAKKLKEQQQQQDQQTSEQVQNLPTLHLFSSPVAIFEFAATLSDLDRQIVFSYRLPHYQAPLAIAVPPPCAG